MFGPIYKKYRERIERKRERKRQLNIVGIKNHRSAAVRGGGASPGAPPWVRSAGRIWAQIEFIRTKRYPRGGSLY